MSAYANDPRVTWDHGAARFVNPADGQLVRLAYDNVFQRALARFRPEWLDMDVALYTFLGDPR